MSKETNSIEENNFMRFNTQKVKLIFFVGAILLFYGINPHIDLFVILAVISLISISSFGNTIMLYIFILPWEYLISFDLPLIGSLYTLVSLIVLFKIILKNFKTQKYGLTKLNIIFVFIFTIYSVINLLLYKSFTGFGFLVDLLIIIYIYRIKQYKYNEFWEMVFHVLVLSTVFASLYGLLHGNFSQRWISGYGYIQQFHGTIGTSRFGIFINISILFVLITHYSKALKLILLGFLYTMLFMTASLAGFYINFFILFMYIFLFETKIRRMLYNKKYSFRRRVVSISLFLFFLIFIIVFRKEIPIVNNLFFRVSYMFENLFKGEIDTALSSRTMLAALYLQIFNHLNWINRLFGIGCFSPRNAFNILNFSHNTYIDMLFLGGYFLVFLLVISLVYILYQQKQKKYFYVILLFKLIVIISGFDTSMLTASFWYVWLLI